MCSAKTNVSFIYSIITLFSKIAYYLRDDTHMTSMKIVKYLRPPTTLVHLRQKFFNPLDLGRPIQANPPPPLLPLSLPLQMITNQLKENIIQG